MSRPHFLIQPPTSYTGIITEPSNRLISLTTQQIIASLRDEGIPLSIIAQIAKVERKTFYSWLNGKSIRIDNQERLEKLYELLFRDKQSSLLYLYRYWNRKTATGLSLCNLFTEDNLNSTVINKALLELWPLAKKYELELCEDYIEANEDKGQLEVINDWRN
ncbi:MAG TPA: hypothetical protein VHZ50_16455 [Puia sp.]|jgi:hypothetical protein|nr:hypothetical protein [Puia sp.]